MFEQRKVCLLLPSPHTDWHRWWWWWWYGLDIDVSHCYYIFTFIVYTLIKYLCLVFEQNKCVSDVSNVGRKKKLTPFTLILMNFDSEYDLFFKKKKLIKNYNINDEAICWSVGHKCTSLANFWKQPIVYKWFINYIINSSLNTLLIESRGFQIITSNIICHIPPMLNCILLQIQSNWIVLWIEEHRTMTCNISNEFQTVCISNV